MANKCKRGYKKVFGKCKRIKKSSSRKKKSYNPLKMWGAWAGAIFFLILTFAFFSSGLTSGLITGKCTTYGTDVFSGQTGIQYRDCTFFDYVQGFFGVLLVALPGFLIGWLIHSTFRRLRK